MEYFRLNLYRQGKSRVQKGIFGLRPEVAAAAPAFLMGLALLLFAFQVYLPERAALRERRQEIEAIQKQIDSLLQASQIIKPLERQFLELRRERINLTPLLQGIAETVPQRVWITGLEWKPAPVTGRAAPANDPFAFRNNELTLKGRAFSRPGQAPLGLVNEFITALAAEDRLGGKYSVELGRTFETRVQRPQTPGGTSTIGGPTQLMSDYRSVLDFAVHGRVREQAR